MAGTTFNGFYSRCQLHIHCSASKQWCFTSSNTFIKNLNYPSNINYVSIHNIRPSCICDNTQVSVNAVMHAIPCFLGHLGPCFLGTARVVDSLTVCLMMSVFSHIYFSTVCLQIIVLVEFRYDEYMWVLLPETGVSDRDNCLSMPEILASSESLYVKRFIVPLE